MSHLEHIGIALDGSDAVATFERLLEAATYKTEEVSAEAVQTYFIDVGGPRIELLTTADPGSAIGRFLTKRGEGIHHLAFEVEDIDATFERVERAGFPLASSRVTDGADGKRVFFVHPKGTHGVLIEFCQSARPVLGQVEVEIGDTRFGLQRGGLATGSSVLILADDRDKSATDLLVRALEPDHSIMGLVRRDETPWPGLDKVFDTLNFESGASASLSGMPAAVVLRGDYSKRFAVELAEVGYTGALIVFVDRLNADGLLADVDFPPRTLLVTTGLSASADMARMIDARSGPGTDPRAIDLITVPTREKAYTASVLPLVLPTIRWFLKLGSDS